MQLPAELFAVSLKVSSHAFFVCMSGVVGKWIEAELPLVVSSNVIKLHWHELSGQECTKNYSGSKKFVLKKKEKKR